MIHGLGFRALAQVILVAASSSQPAFVANHSSPVDRSFAVCASESIGVDTSLANNSGDVLLGEAIGQTFVVVDTLLSSLSVWRVADECQNFLIGIHLYITKTDSGGTPVTPDIVLDGPTLVIPNGDCIHPIKFEWNFDPPLALPGPGTYAFFLQVPSSQCPSYFNLLAHTGTPDAYTGGHGWLTGRTDFCDLAQGIVSVPDGDYVFTAVFCNMHVTPTVHRSWGDIKVFYR